MLNTLNQIMTGVLIVGMFTAVLSIVYVSLRNGISPMPSTAPVRQVVTAEIKRITNRKSIVEAGSGFGTLAIHMGKYHTDSQIIGLENSRIPLWISKLLARMDNRTNVTFLRRDLYTYSYKDADLVVCYLYPGAMKRLTSIWSKGLNPGAQVISVCFAIPDWEPDRVTICKDIYHTKVYIYTVS
ncbi:SAM-dependent methyltransferase [Paenibacillus sp. DS2015]|uniref:class I SAM-dependent methyltransferase n=1 Tax=Paenibacillus sp. DS2015 TaxID=3373917 RepID=UPI003D2516F6